MIGGSGYIQMPIVPLTTLIRKAFPVSFVLCVALQHVSHYVRLQKKQATVSHSTAESEMVAGDLGLRTEALPLMIRFYLMPF